MSDSEIGFEDKLKRLEEIATRMESRNISIDESIKLFEEGVKLGKECREHLKSAELKVNKILDEIEKEP